MITLSNFDSPSQDNRSIFDCVSTHNEHRVKSHNSTLLGYMVSVGYPNEMAPTFDYVNGIFEQNEIAFSANQTSVISLSYHLFSDSVQLSELENRALDNTIKEMAKTKPTLPGRK